MNAKEKAAQLVSIMSDKAYESDCFGNEYEVAKQCALIAVDEIIKSNPTIPTKGTYLYLDMVDESISYWQEVKTEIKAL